MRGHFDPLVSEKIRNFKLAFLLSRDVTVSASGDRLLKTVEATAAQLRREITLTYLEHDSDIKSYRRMWWAFSVDPTKLRPSPEALLRRILSSRRLNSVNNLVDVTNLLSLKTKLSTRIHDLDTIVGDTMVVRKANRGEIFIAIGTKGQIPLKDGELVVADKEKILDLMYSTSSSNLTKVSASTKRAIFTIYPHPDTTDLQLHAAMEKASKHFKDFCDIQFSEKSIGSCSLEPS